MHERIAPNLQTLSYPTVIIGSGFAGRTVAQHLKAGEYIILERGENRSYGDTLKRYDAAVSRGLRPLDAESVAFASERPWNQFQRLSRYNYSNFAMIRGGASNWWGGKTTRLSPAVFASNDGLQWAMGLDEMVPWYERAERLLNVAGDPLTGSSRTAAHLEGAAYWRNAFSPYLQPSGIYEVAINKSAPEGTSTGQGHCIGRGHCAVCKQDAKARPDNIFPEHDMLFDAFVHEIQFDGDQAAAVLVYDGRQVFRVECARVVLAANGVETPRLLARSKLPSGVNVGALGHFCQDHAHLEIDCWIPKPIAYGALGGLSHVVVRELSRMYETPLGSIETSALALTHEPPQDAFHLGLDPAWTRSGDIGNITSGLRGCFRIFVELETPMQIKARVDLESDLPAICDDGYAELIPHFDTISDQMCRQLESQGVSVKRLLRHYRHGYGGHHFVGTTNWSRGPHNMLDNDARLGGTRNVYIAGASILPRAGGVAPTLTLVALAERLGVHLEKL